MDTQSFFLGILAAAIVGGGGYYLGSQQDRGAASPAVSTSQASVQATQPADPLITAVTEYTTQANSVPPNPELNQPIGQNNFEHFRVGNKNVKSMLADGPIIWIGTSGGVIRYDTRDDSHTVFDTRSGLLANGIFHLSKFNGNLMAGTYGGGFSILDEKAGNWKNYNVPEGLADAFVYDMLETENGDLWIATWSGANRVKEGKLDDPASWDTFTVENTNGGLPNDWVYGLRKGQNGEIWMATEGGLARYQDGSWSNWAHSDGLGAPYELVKNQTTIKNDPAKVSSHHARQKEEMGLQGIDIAYNPNYIVSLHVDGGGVVWAGTWGGGLARYEAEQWKNYTMADGLPSNYVSLLNDNENGELWVGTSGGLSSFDGTEFKVYDKDDGLFANSVFSMAKSEDDSLWIGSYGGVARIFDLASFDGKQ